MGKQIDILQLSYYIINSGRFHDLNHLKLQKLLYYIQSWHLVFRGQPLFANQFEAWVHGPVSREVFAHFKSQSLMYDKLTPNPNFDTNIQNVLDLEQIEIIEDVLGEYGDKTPYHLECLTHREQPWIEARGNCSETEICTTYIDNDTISRYYTSLLNG